MRLVSAFLATLLFIVGPGAAEAATAKPQKVAAPVDTRVWTIAKGEGTYVLRYAQPRDLDPDFALTCQPSGRLLQIAIEVVGKPFSSGDGVPISLINGKRRLELAATAFLGSDGALVVEAAVSLEPRVFDLFRGGDTLVVKMPAANPKTAAPTQSYPLAGARARLADFENVCLGRR